MMMPLAINPDTESRVFVRQAWVRFAWYFGCMSVGWLLLSHHTAAELAAQVRLIGTIGALVATSRALRVRAPVHAPHFTYWDEGLLLTLFAIGIRIGERLTE